jgi:alpha-N-acetylglucosaminidase
VYEQARQRMIQRYLWTLGIAAGALTACTATYVSVPDPLPVIGAQLIGRAGECVDARDGQTADGTPLVVVQCHGSPNERWFIKQGVISENFGSCIDVLGSVPIDGAALVLVNCIGAPSQQWSIRDGQIVGFGGKCLTETGGDSADQTPLILSTCNAEPGQVWTIR